jgi:hypothetical protein
MTLQPSQEDVRRAVCIEVIDGIREFTDLDRELALGALYDHLRQFLARHSLITTYWRQQPRRRQFALINQALEDLQIFTPGGELIPSRFYDIAWGQAKTNEADTPEAPAP